MKKKTAEEAYRPFREAKMKFLPFRDAGKGASVFNLQVSDCISGIAKAHYLGFINFKTFDYKDYEFYEKVEHGDWNWIVPGKFLAFATPKGSPKAYYELPPGMN